MEISIRLEGVRPILMHNVRLANPLDPYTRRLKEAASKKDKTDEDLAVISWIEARGSAYETADGLLAIPAENVFSAIWEGAKGAKKGMQFKRAILPLTDLEPIYIDGETYNVDDYLDAGNIDVRPVKVQRNRVMRSRPIIRAPWTVTHRFEMMTDEFNFDQLQAAMNRAGRLVGIGDYRPRYGTFIATFEEVS